MVLPLSKYAEITSGVAGTGSIRERELIGRLWTTNYLSPTQSIIEFESADQVGDYYGFDSTEYARAEFYFGWISKSITRAQKISFARWVNLDTAPMIFGFQADYDYNDFVGISDGSFNMVDGATVNAVTGIDFTTVTSLTDVAAELETAIQALATGYYTAATVTYNATTKRFEFVGGVTGTTAAISATANGAGTSIVNMIGWGSGAIYSKGSGEETLAETLAFSDETNDNFASIAFVDVLTEDQYVECAEWLSTTNNKYMLCVADDVDALDPVDYILEGYAGVGVTATNSIATEFPEMIPMIVAASTDYNNVNASKNYMYQTFPTVSALLFNGEYLGPTEATALEGARINFYAATQTAGQYRAFYQRGVLQGGPNNPSDMNVYVNEIWLKARAEFSIMNLLLTLEEISADDEGRAQLIAILQQDVANPAIDNGVITVGKTFTSTQKEAISQITGDNLAWQQVQNNGYWLNVVIVPVIGETTEYKAVYTLVYSKDDVIRKVEGRHVLI